MIPPRDGPGRGTRETLVRIGGIVQGVGFRPFVVRLALAHGMTGWVRNDGRGVGIRLRSSADRVEAFLADLRRKLPPAARIDEFTTRSLDPADASSPLIGGQAFVIIASPEETEAPLAAVTPDLALCEDCRRELLDPADRRHGYPFINCTNCGPRYSIIRELPYDRAHTTMAGFTMCPACAAEYGDVLDRRYHAQPDACPACGPEAALIDAAGRLLADKSKAIRAAAGLLLAGKIVAVKGLGGFHLFADARADGTVNLLRTRKHRDEKPFAVMFPSLEALHRHARPEEDEIKLLQSPAAPIVLIKRRPESGLSLEIAPGNPWIGALLPYTPLHVLLMEACGAPMIATSANLSEEPLCTDNEEARQRLKGIADAFLIHDRPIARPVDDSVQRVTATGPILLRRARGYAPDPLPLPDGCAVSSPLLAVGGHLKNTIAVALSGKVVLSPHIGDLANVQSVEAFRKTITLLTDLYGGQTGSVACDLHPDYTSTRYAAETGLPVIPVQHHLAHVLACLLEHGGGPEKVLGVSWDGTGYGEDRTIWGGEFILVDRVANTARRVAHLRPFPLPGGEEAVRRTGRSALGALYQAGLLAKRLIEEQVPGLLGEESPHLRILVKAMENGLNAPLSSSAGRLFDAVAALLQLARRNRFEGQGGMAVEFAATRAPSETGSLPFRITEPPGPGKALQVDWAPALEILCRERRTGTHPDRLAMRFHRCLADMVAEVSARIGVEAVALTGGCFQNALLTGLSHAALTARGHTVLLHRQLPPNDNAIAAGQALGALWGITRVESPA